MKPSDVQSFPLLAVSILLVSLAPAALASVDRNDREVRIVYIEGDVRLSRGHANHPDLKQRWEAAQAGELIEQGFALATGIGRAELEFENGSTVFLAENSLLIFRKLPAPADRIVSHVALPTGSATFWVPSAAESFFIETATDTVQIIGPETSSLRFDAYLDATGITPLGGKLGSIKGAPTLQVASRQTVFFQGGAVLSAPEPDENLPWKESADGTPDPEMRFENYLFRAGEQRLVRSDWDQWVEARVQQKKTTMAAALKASGLSSSLPGLADLYSHGDFFPCEPYGTCWEPTQTQSAQQSDPQQMAPQVQTTSPNVGFQPQTVQWQEPEYIGPCDSYGGYRTITRIARTPQELQELLRLKSLANANGYYRSSAFSSCYEQPWIHHHGHYAMVLPHRNPVCSAKRCKPVHPPRPIFVRVGSHLGFVPRHPDDAKGKPPINLKHGIIALPTRPSDAPRQIALDPSQKIIFLDKPPKEFERDIASKPLSVAAPEIRAHLIEEETRGSSTTAANHTDSHIVYNYKTQAFVMPAAPASGSKAKDIPVGEMASNGRVATFANNGFSGRAESVGRGSDATSYNGGGNSGSHSFSSGSAGSSSSHSSSASAGASVSTPSFSSTSNSSSSSGASHGSRP